MELLENPDVKATYDKCKYIVKLWEHNFKKTTGRLPSKLDIREADKNVRDAYRKYFQLKTAALEQSFKDVDGFHSDNEDDGDGTDCANETIPNTEASDVPIIETPQNPKKPLEDTWGSHLDKQVKTDEKDINNGRSNTPTLNSSFANKLFCGSKFSKRNPRKSMSFTHRKSEIIENPQFLSQTSSHTRNDVIVTHSLTKSEAQITSFEGLFSGPSVKIINSVDKITSQSTNIIQSVLNNKPLKSVDAGWMSRVEQSTGLQHYEDDDNFCLDYESDDIIDNSDDETALNQENPAKKFKYSFVDRKKSEEVAEAKTAQKNEEQVVEAPTDVPHLPAEEIEVSQPIQKSSGESQSNLKTPKARKKVTKIKSDDKEEESDENPGEIRRSARKPKTIYDFAESNSENEDPYKCDDDSDDPEFDLNPDKKKFPFIMQNSPETSPEKDTPVPNKPPTKRKTPKSETKKKTGTNKKSTKSKETKHDKENEDEDEETTYELEYSIKPRVSIPRFRNLKKLINSEKAAEDDDQDEEQGPSSSVKTKRQQMREKLEKKIQSGSLNENFVTIDLKKKIYVRGKKNTNFSKFKKQQWKNKKKALAGPDMDMGGCDGGLLTCFTCGDVGHFSRNCMKINKGDGLLPARLAQDEEKSVTPTLEEAAKMARENISAVRKPNIICEEDNPDVSSEDDVFDDDDTEALLAEALKLEEHVAKVDLQQYLDYVRVVDPLYKLKEDGSVIETPPEVFDALREFGHSQFREGQERAVMRILSGQSTLVTLSTGTGKSLCYQLPAYLYSRRSPCISLIISPLVSLMEDQVTGIPSFLRAACLHTNKTKAQRAKILEAISEGSLDVLLVSPEAVVAGEKSSGFGSILRKLPPIAFACIDEAHCVSQWSHNFRPSYLMICRVLRERLGVKTVLGLTATATRATCDSIISHLEISDGMSGVISDTPLPDNLTLSVSKDGDRDRALLCLLTSERFVNCKSIIIYCTRRDECNRLTSFLRTSLQYSKNISGDNNNGKKRKRVSVQAEPYHAGLSASRRRTIQKSFMNGDLRIVVATVAFGMGINKSDIRSVIHYNMPKSFESYVQEIGRAGRDGLEAHCHLFLDSKGKDENELRRHIHANSIDRQAIRKLLQKIFVPCSCKTGCPKHEVAFSIEETVRELDIPEENISTLLCYLELHVNKYVELLSPAYTRCKVISYGGANEIVKASKECPPLAMALALRKGTNEQNVVEFAVVDIAAAIGWDSGICKHKLKNLEWGVLNGQPKRSMLSVQFSNLGFRLLAPGNLAEDQLDEALDSLYGHVVSQEKTALLQLRAVHQTLVDVAAPSYKACLSREASEDIDATLKSKIRAYFESPNPLESVELARDDDKKIVDEELLVNNIRCIINMYRDTAFTGRAIARIFHGIMSPNYPAVIWGRCKFWRSHINVDFHTIYKLATREILNMR